MEKYVLVELVCVLCEVRPFFSIGDAMWCLLICDMNVSHACAMDSTPLGSLVVNGNENFSASLQSRPSRPPTAVEKFVASRKVSGITKREYILRQKSLQLQKGNRTSGSRGTSRKLRSFGGLVLDEKIKSLADSASMKMKNASIKVNKILVAIPLDNVQKFQ
ncbi:hypothetical protein K7X08_032035 [Anisodus acutangulus]|uniref:PIR2-like helical domain-containing protein n=1 Tax=Anisodus acutangulus TaxID=402998 RepID=A0A9Q1RJV9_9SOLA|nr:hypothetical protein K7X08_032035 [Anisodus acutangulus]